MKIEDLIRASALDGVDVSMENYEGTLAGFLHAMEKSFSMTFKKIINTAAIIQVPTPTNRGDLEKAYDNVAWSELSKMRCYVPAQMKGNLAIHAEVLLEQMTAFSDYEERLLRPLMNYCAKVIGDPSLVEKTMVVHELKAVNTDALKKKLFNTFDEGSMQPESPFEKTYGTAYSNKVDIYETAQNLTKLREQAGRIDLDRLAKLEERLSGMINDVIEIIEQKEANKQFIQKLAQTVQSASVELEYIAALMYFTTANINAFNFSTETTIDALER